MRNHYAAARAAHWSLAGALITLQVTMEEVVFRGVMISFLQQPVGAVAAAAISGALFAVMQAFHMPTWKSAMFPVIGALVMGLVHGWLLLATGLLVPLIVAHIVFFVFAVL